MEPAIEFETATVRRDGRAIVDRVSWRVEPPERWVILGPNGAGKTTALRVAAARLHPYSGTVRLFGRTVGRVDVRTLWPRIAFVSSAVEQRLVQSHSALDVVLTGKLGALATYWDSFDPDDRARADELLARFGCERVAAHPFATLSDGERKRVQIARALMSDPALLLLDEPAAGLDIAGREQLLQALTGLATDATEPPLVLVTHHVEEIPPGVTHVALLRDGAIVTSGGIDTGLTSGSLSETFGIPLRLVRAAGGRLTASA